MFLVLFTYIAFAVKNRCIASAKKSQLTHWSHEAHYVISQIYRQFQRVMDTYTRAHTHTIHAHNPRIGARFDI